MSDTSSQYDDITVDKATGSNFRVLNTASDLVSYTDKVTQNRKNFSELARHTTAKYLRDAANEICRCLSDANYISDKTFTKLETRLELQEQAIRACNYMLVLIERAQLDGHIDIRRRQYWGNKVTSLRRAITSWHSSDKQRYHV